MSSEESRKRPRVDQDGVEEVRDKEFWFDDGNVVLVARDVRFKVYMGPLATHSAVFKDMFSLPQPPVSDGGERGCPVIHLDDSPEDLRHILGFLMQGATLRDTRSLGTQIPPSFHEISAYVRLGDKYQLAQLMQYAVDYLKRHYPTNFDAWTKSRASGPPGFEPIHAIGVVSLLRLADACSTLPVVFLACCGLGAQIATGFTREDGTPERLSYADLGLCFVARDALLRAKADAAAAIVAPGGDGPAAAMHHRCPNVAHKLYMALAARKVDAFPENSLSISWRECARALEPGITMCAECMSSMDTREAAARRAVWAKLPSIMGLEVEGWGS